MRHEQLSVGELTANHILGGAVGPVTQGEKYYLDFGAGAGYRGKTPGTPFNTLEKAEAALTANQNDILYYLQDNSSGAFAELLTWDKDYTHFIGVTAATRIAQRARLFSAAAQTVGNMLITAKGCTFANMYWFWGSSSDTDIYNVYLSGGRNHFFNVHIAGIGHATPAARAGAMNLHLDGAEENYFEDCTIGLTTITRTAANSIIQFDGNCHRNIFERCRIISAAENATYPIVKLQDTSGADDFNEFVDCLFYNFWSNHADKLNQVFSTGATGITKDIIVRNCMAVGADCWQDDDASAVWGNMPAVDTAGGIAAEISE